MSSLLPSSKNSSSKRPLIKIATKKKKRSIAKISNGSSNSFAAVGETTSRKKLPSILTRRYEDNNSVTKQQINTNNIHNNSNDDGNDHDFEDDEIFAKMLEQYVHETEDLHEILLAIQSLIRRHSAAICSLVQIIGNTDYHQSSYIPFVLKPMVKNTLQSKSKPLSHTTAGTTCRSNSTSSSFLSNLSTKSSIPTKLSRNQSDQIASAYMSTGFDMELDELDSENKVRLIQLQGMDGGDDDSSRSNGGSSNADENIAIVLMNDYICAVYNAATATSAASTAESRICSNEIPSSSKNLNNEIQIKMKAQRETSSIHQEMYEKEVIVKLFLDCIHYHGCNGTFVSVSKLVDALKSAWDVYREGNTTDFQIRLEGNKSKMSILCHPEKWIEQLVHMQLLLPRVLHNSQTSCTTSYWYTLPKMGMAANIIAEGRKKMMNKIQRSYNKEIRRSVLENMNINIHNRKQQGSIPNIGGKKLSNMTGSFHLRDLIARDVVKIVHRPSGEFVKFK